ncbi:hypothetical protein EIP91_003356 [Steccherinum ochraceum]|uniref:Uracil-DNA glycosylase-like domain-containing protein n=1 Tax=Steccherinum ochraceum TaxID=92696 RepID=A0A4R0RAL8_9APHY|nr:hypothetical protein EIP91_003356 [Steccherinum ochraceum]
MVLTQGIKVETPERFRAALEAFRFDSPAQTPGGSTLRRSARKRSTGAANADEDDVLPTLEDVQVKEEVTATVITTRTSRKRSTPIKAEGTPNVKKIKRGFAPPEQYAHLNFLQDHLQDGLDVMFCGVNPGCKSAEVGHHFANPTNHFWRCLHLSQFTDRLLPPAEDGTLPALYNVGLTNLVARPSAEQAELSKADMISGVPVLLHKIATHRPRIVCFVGKGIWDVFVKEATKASADVPGAIPGSPSTPGLSTSIPGGMDTPRDEFKEEEDEDVLPSLVKTPAPVGSKRGKQAKRGKKVKTVFNWDIQPFKVVHSESDHAVKESLFFVMPSTSGRVVSHQLPDKVKLFSTLRDRVGEVRDGSVDTSDMAVISLPALTTISSE